MRPLDNVQVEPSDLTEDALQSSSILPPCNSCSNYDATSPNIRNSWSLEQRVTLAMLAGWYDTEWKNVTLIFNKCYEDVLPFPQGLTKAALIAQYYGMRGWFDVNAALRDLENTSFFLSYYTKNSKTVVQRTLEECARNLHITLVPKLHQAKQTAKKAAGFGKSVKRKRCPVYTDDLDNLTLEEATDFNCSHSGSDTHLRSPKKRYPFLPPQAPLKNSSALLHNCLPSPPSTGNSTRQPEAPGRRPLPHIAFRACKLYFHLVPPLSDFLLSIETCFGSFYSDVSLNSLFFPNKKC